MIKVESLWKAYGRHVAIRDVSFHVPRGQVAGFLGPNGAGKTTVMRILTTFLPPNAGRVLVSGLDVTRQARAVCRVVGYLPEAVPVYPELRVEEYLRYRASLHGFGGKQRRSRVDHVSEQCGIRDVSRQLLGSLSKGYRQRVGLADALIGDPELLILDEPTSGLDPRQVTEVRRMIEGFRGERTVLLSSHILGEVEQVCDQVIILHRGRIRAHESRDGWRHRLREARRLELVLDEPPASVKDDLSRIPGVVDVVSDGASHFTLQTRRDVRLAIFELAKEKNWKLLELRTVEATLESLFLEVTETDGESVGGGAA